MGFGEFGNHQEPLNTFSRGKNQVLLWTIKVVQPGCYAACAHASIHESADTPKILQPKPPISTSNTMAPQSPHLRNTMNIPQSGSYIPGMSTTVPFQISRASRIANYAQKSVTLFLIASTAYLAFNFGLVSTNIITNARSAKLEEQEYVCLRLVLRLCGELEGKTNGMGICSERDTNKQLLLKQRR